jgi:hypothetical protein
MFIFLLSESTRAGQSNKNPMQLRGQKALMAIVSNKVKIASEKHVKGCFTDGRDDALACRFFYHGHLSGKRYDVCLLELSNEFFISGTVISQHLMQRQEFIKQLRVDNVNRRDLQKRYPFFNWN